MSDVKFGCPHCKQSLEAPESILGQVIECPSCNGSIRIPGPESERGGDPAPSRGKSDTSPVEIPALASAGQRFGGYLIDGVAISILAAAFATLLMLGSDLSEHAEMGKAAAANAFGWYYWLFECIWGRTLGKFTTGTKVVNVDSTQPAPWWRVALRMLVRFVPFEPFSYFITGQRGVMWHDRWTGTRVIKWPPIHGRPRRFI